MVVGKKLRGLSEKLDKLRVQNALVECWSNNEKPWRISRNSSAQLWPLDVTIAPNGSRWILLRSTRRWLCDLIGLIFIQVYYTQFIMQKRL